MATAGRDSLYWTSWLLAAGLTGIVAGFMLGHALLLAVAPPGLFGQTDTRVRSAEGRAGLQILAVTLFLLLALVRRRHRAAAVIAGAAGAGTRPCTTCPRWR
jgi:hypothetical protein